MSCSGSRLPASCCTQGTILNALSIHFFMHTGMELRVRHEVNECNEHTKEIVYLAMSPPGYTRGFGCTFVHVYADLTDPFMYNRGCQMCSFAKCLPNVCSGRCV